MANIFRSKEIYTKHGGVLYTSRGVYVSGIHKEPYYIDHTTHVKNISTTKAVVNDMTILEKSHTDTILNLTNIELLDMEIVSYGNAKTKLPEDTILSLTGVDVGSIELIQYHTNYVKLDTENIMNLTSIDIGDMELIQYETLRYDVGKEFIVCVIDISTTKATITNKSI